MNETPSRNMIKGNEYVQPIKERKREARTKRKICVEEEEDEKS